MTAIAVFCGSKEGSNPAYRQAAAQVGQLIAAQGWGLVYGGGRVGLMGAVADACLAAGGQVIGVIPQKLKDREVAHPGLTRLHVVQTMAERKDLMLELSDAFISLPGGMGTLDEMFEVLTLAQLSYHHKPSAILNQDGFYQGLLTVCQHMQQEGFLYPGVWDAVLVEAAAQSLIQSLVQRLAAKAS